MLKMTQPGIHKPESGVSGNSDAKPEIVQVEDDLAKPESNDLNEVSAATEAVVVSRIVIPEERRFVNAMVGSETPNIGNKPEELAPIGEIIQVVVEKASIKRKSESPKARMARSRSRAAAAKMEIFTNSMESVATTLEKDKLKSRAVVCQAFRNFIILYTTLGIGYLVYFVTTQYEQI